MTQNQKIMVFAKGANGFYWLSFCKILFGPMLNLPNLVYCSYAICPTDTRSFSHYSPMFCISNSISLDKNPFTPDNAVLSSGEISECILLTERGQWLAIVWHLFVVTRYWVLLARLASHTCGHACVSCFPMAVRWRDHPLPPPPTNICNPLKTWRTGWYANMTNNRHVTTVQCRSQMPWQADISWLRLRQKEESISGAETCKIVSERSLSQNISLTSI